MISLFTLCSIQQSLTAKPVLFFILIVSPPKLLLEFVMLTLVVSAIHNGARGFQNNTKKERRNEPPNIRKRQRSRERRRVRRQVRKRERHTQAQSLKSGRNPTNRIGILTVNNRTRSN
jgi:hypothetical protein